MASGTGRPMRVAVVDDYEIVVAGITAVLAGYEDRVSVLEVGLDELPVRDDVDIVLYDTFGHTHDHELELAELSSGGMTKVVVFSWDAHPDKVRRALERGAAGYVVKSLSADGIIDALERVHAGETVVPADPEVCPSDLTVGWPGQQAGLSHREAEVVALIAQGLSNEGIAAQLFLSVNSVKTYIRTAYRKIDVTRRAQAVRWALEHGFASETGGRAGSGSADPPAAR